MLGTDVLPVGVTPITAVPTRLLYGEAPVVHVWFANRTPEQFDISRLPEFVAEQLNRGNEKHVTRIVAQLPSPRLREGIAFVDTPGLGSLATRGAGETLAYLPRCDLGVVLIDAGSTLTPDDLQTIQILYDAAIPAMVLLSKADLLTLEDRLRVIGYVKEHIKEELNLDLAVRAVSVMAGSIDLLAQWFDEVTFLYSRRQELKLRSIRRKLGALRQLVEMALRTRLRRKDQISPKKVKQLRVVEAELRQASGRLEEMKNVARGVANDLEYSSNRILRFAAATLVGSWSKQGAGDEAVESIVRNAVTWTVEEQTESLRRHMDAMTHKLHETLRATAKVLEVEDVPGEQEFSGVVREMPAFDPGQLNIHVKRPFLFGLLKGSISRSIATKRLAGMVGGQLTKSLTAYHALLYDWSERTVGQIQRRFDAYANSYRAQVERLVGGRVSPAEQESTIRRDLEGLEGIRSEPTVAS